MVEILLVIAILAIVLSFISPAFRTDQVQATFTKVKQTIEYARQLAILNRKTIECVISVEVDPVDGYNQFYSMIRENGTTVPFENTERANFGENTDFFINGSVTQVTAMDLILSFNKRGELTISGPATNGDIFSVRNILNNADEIRFFINDLTGELRRQ